jgi:TolA-binding protein
MHRSSLFSLVTLLALLGAAPVVGVGGEAWAQQTGKAEAPKKDERKALKLNDMDQQTQSDAYRKAARDKRHESMNFLKDILANRAPQGTQKAEMMLRLAELYSEEGRDIKLDELSRFNAEYDKCFGTKGCVPEKMVADHTESRKWADRAIKLYQQILQNYPQYQRADEATFYLANALSDIGEREKAVEQFTGLVKTYSESAYVPDAYVQIGEYFFDTNNAYKALLAYEKAAKYKDSPQYAFSNYKLAWCLYNVGDYGKAIDKMKSVVQYSMTVQEGAGAGDSKKRMTLQEEALKDLVRFFADAGQMDEAYNYFTKLGKKDLIKDMLKRLAGTYFEQGKFEECIQTYRRLISENPQGKEAPEYQNEIIQAYTKMNKKAETLQEIDRLQKTYGKTSAWARANSADQDAVKAAQEYVEKNLRTVATNYHNEAKKIGTGKAAVDTYNLAYKAYTAYLSEYPEGKYTYDVRYAFGELLYKVKKFDEAYEQYMKVVQTDPKGQHSRFCAESAIFAADEMIKVSPKPPKPPDNKTSTDLTDWEKKLLEACDQYSKLFKDEKVNKIIYKSAYLLYNHNQFKDASDRFRTVISMDPKSKEAEQAANLILDSFNLVEDWQNLKEVSKAFYSQDGLGSPGFKKEVYAVYERASLKLVDINFAKNKDEKAAADGYAAFYAEFPSSEVADYALNNAAFYYGKQGQTGKAMVARETLIQKFPSSKFFKDQVASLGFDYESVADFTTAAMWYEKLFSLDKEHKDAKLALFSAALFRKGMGDWNAAIKNYTEFIKAYPTDERIPGLYIGIAQIYEEQKKWTEASNAYQTFFSKPPTGASAEQVYYARLHYGLAQEAMNQTGPKLEKHYQETIAAFQAQKAKGEETGSAVEFIAQILFKRATPIFNSYMALKISGPSGKASRKETDATLVKQLGDKARALQEIEKLYVEIVKTGAGEWGLASLVQLGKAYENMGTTLETSYMPEYLNEEQRFFYSNSLKDKAYVQVEKAVNVYAEALKKAYELNLYNENTDFATRQLGKLRPDDFPALVEELPMPRFTSRSVAETKFEEKP